MKGKIPIDRDEAGDVCAEVSQEANTGLLREFERR